jgi:hypothetical protein
MRELRKRVAVLDAPERKARKKPEPGREECFNVPYGIR